MIETTFSTAGGRVKIVDPLAFAESQRTHDLGMAAPHLLLRLVEGVEGESSSCNRRNWRAAAGLCRSTHGGG